MSSVLKEKQIHVKFNFKNRKIANETYQFLRDVYGNERLSREKVFEIFKRFQDG